MRLASPPSSAPRTLRLVVVPVAGLGLAVAGLATVGGDEPVGGSMRRIQSLLPALLLAGGVNTWVPVLAKVPMLVKVPLVGSNQRARPELDSAVMSMVMVPLWASGT